MPLVYSAFVPHPPVLISEIGSGQEQICLNTLESYREIGRRLSDSSIDTLVIVSPHAPLLEEGLTVLSNEYLRGSFSSFGFPDVKFSFENNMTLVDEFHNTLVKCRPISREIDHGALVPLYFFNKAGWEGKIVVLGMPLNNPEKYGQLIGNILRQNPIRSALIASGDLSHRLLAEGPYGFNPAGSEFDGKIVEGLKGDISKLKSIDPDLAEEAGECGYRSLLLALAAREGSPEVLSYEGPFGVGYLVAELYRSSSQAQWARQCLEDHILKNNNREIPEAPEFKIRRACFVTLKKNGELRGCIGTTQSWQENLALEIQHNAIAAGTEDPRFWPVEKEELDQLTISVDVLGDLEKVNRYEELNAWRYGVIVRAHGKTGLLLPHLEGVNTVDQQISIAKQKAGLEHNAAVDLWRFEVTRYYE